jgi:hypothetical protein
MNQKNGLVPYGEPSKFLNVAIVFPQPTRVEHDAGRLFQHPEVIAYAIR